MPKDQGLDAAKDQPAAASVPIVPDFDRLQKVVEEAAHVSSRLWLTHLLTLFYFGVAAAGVTHGDLLLETPIRLPFLNVELPLRAFFVVAPGLVLLVHAYVLVHVVLLGSKVGLFDRELRAHVVDAREEARSRQQLPVDILVQTLSGPKETRRGAFGALLRLIPQVSIVAGPLGLLVFLQLQFLPFHDASITWWHRIALVLDVALLWIMWPSVARGRIGHLSLSDLKQLKTAGLLLASVLLIAFSVGVATFPGELMERVLPAFRIVPSRQRASDRSAQFSAGQEAWHRVSLHDALFEDGIDFVSRKPRSPWSNRLVLPGFSIDATQAPSASARANSPTLALSLRGRHLEGAVMIGAHLRGADFTGAWLSGANLSDADLREATFGCDNGSFVSEGLYEKSLGLRSGIPGDDADCAHLEDSTLDRALLQSATFVKAWMQGASLKEANLAGADLTGARLTGGTLTRARMVGAVLDRTELQGATFQDAHLNCAWLGGADLRGAWLSATLDGALLEKTDLRGAHVSPTSSRGARVRRALVWRSDGRQGDFEGSRVEEPVAGACERPEHCWSSERYSTLRTLMEARLTSDHDRSSVVDSLVALNPQVAVPDEMTMAEFWRKKSVPVDTGQFGEASREFVAFDDTVADAWAKSACNSSDGQHIIRGWLLQFERGALMFRSRSFHVFYSAEYTEINLPDLFLDSAKCPGSQELPAETIQKLREIRARP